MASHPTEAFGEAGLGESPGTAAAQDGGDTPANPAGLAVVVSPRDLDPKLVKDLMIISEQDAANLGPRTDLQGAILGL